MWTVFLDAGILAPDAGGVVTAELTFGQRFLPFLYDTNQTYPPPVDINEGWLQEHADRSAVSNEWGATFWNALGVPCRELMDEKGLSAEEVVLQMEMADRVRKVAVLCNVAVVDQWLIRLDRERRVEVGNLYERCGVVFHLPVNREPTLEMLQTINMVGGKHAVFQRQAALNISRVIRTTGWIASHDSLRFYLHRSGEVTPVVMTTPPCDSGRSIQECARESLLRLKDLAPEGSRFRQTIEEEYQKIPLPELTFIGIERILDFARTMLVLSALVYLAIVVCALAPGILRRGVRAILDLEWRRISYLRSLCV